MQNDLIHTMTESFEGHAQVTESGVEYWLARDVQYLLGYTKWDNFLNVISKARTACEVSGHSVHDHFADVGKMVDLGSGSQREISEIMAPLDLGWKARTQAELALMEDLLPLLTKHAGGRNISRLSAHEQ